MGFGRRPQCRRGGWHRGRRPKAAREGTRGRLGTISGAALWGFGCSGLSVRKRVRWRGGNVDCFEFGLERRLKANLRLAVRQGGWFGGVWCACDALTLLPAMNRLARARLSGEHSASS
jgi:hypothetical protein